MQTENTQDFFFNCAMSLILNKKAELSQR